MILHRDFTPLPMPQEVIDCVNRLGALDKQPELLTFFDRLGQDIGDLRMHDPSTAGVHGHRIGVNVLLLGWHPVLILIQHVVSLDKIRLGSSHHFRACSCSAILLAVFHTGACPLAR